MYISKLTSYTLAPIGTGNGLNRFNLTLSAGDVCSIHSDSPDDARLLLKALSTLVYPEEGVYHFHDSILDFSDYKKLLFFKRRIGYIAIDSALLSNRTIRQNLLYMWYYSENSLKLSLDDKTEKLCEDFGISDKLDIHAARVGRVDLRVAAMIRELSKFPEILLIERPEDLVGQIRRDLFLEILRDMIALKVPVVYWSYNDDLISKTSNKRIYIENGDLTVTR